MPNPTRRRLSIAAAIAAMLSAPIAYIAVRSKIRLNHTAELIAISDRFPRDYYVCDPKHKPLLYVALGDSTAAGVGASHLGETYPYIVAQKLASQGRYVHVIN